MLARESNAWSAEPTSTSQKDGREKDSIGIVAVIPAYNEERFIGSVVLETLPMVDGVVVVDDGSSDRTARLARAAGADVICLSQNQGKGAALNHGFRRALSRNPRAVVILDADAQHDPEELPIMVEPILNDDADVVIGSRFLGTKNRIPRYRQLGQSLLTKATNVASGVFVTDSQSGYRAFSPAALRQLNFDSLGLQVESEMQFLIKRSNLRVVEVPIHVHYLDKAKRNPIRHGVQILDLLLGLVARRRPLLFFSTPGLLLVLMGVLLGSTVIQTLARTQVLPVGTALVTTMFVISGILLGITGVILHSFDHLVTHLRSEFRVSPLSDEPLDS